MTKKIRKAVRAFLIKENKVVVIQYKTEKNKDYYDIPGGGIEANENSIDASIREFKEETGMEILEQKNIGKVIMEYPHIIFDLDVFLVSNYNKEPQELEENVSLWMDIEEVKKQDKKFPTIEILKHLDRDSIQLKIYADENHNVVKVEELENL